MTSPQRLPCVCYDFSNERPRVSCFSNCLSHMHMLADWKAWDLPCTIIIIYFFFVTDTNLTSAQTGQPVGIPSSAGRRAGMHSPPPRRALVREFIGTYESLPSRSIQVGGPFA